MYTAVILSKRVADFPAAKLIARESATLDEPRAMKIAYVHFLLLRLFLGGIVNRNGPKN